MSVEIVNFRGMYVAELQELRDAELQLTEAQQHMAQIASAPALASAFARHREETLVQKERLDAILRRLGADTRAHRDQAMQSLIAETEKMMSMLKGGDLCDAGIIASAQKIEHYEIAPFGTAAALAAQLGYHEDEEVLHLCLDETKLADAKLTVLATHGINEDAAS